MNDIASKVLLLRTDDTRIQFFRYVFVGAFSAVVDMTSFYLTQLILDAHYIAAQSTGFFLGVTANYILSTAWVFRPTDDRKREISLFFLVGLGGLLLSYLLLWLLIDMAHLTQFHNMVAKAVTIASVLVWNFGMRKRFVF